MSTLPAEALHGLHETERRAREIEGRIAGLRRVLEGDPAAPDARPRLLVAEARRKELARRLEQAETAERTERARARSHEQQLYSGAIRSPKELTQLAAELEHLKARLAIEEDEELELIAALEEAEKEAAQALAEAAAARAALADQERALAGARASLAEQRAGIPQAHLRVYDRVAAYRQPPPVVEARGGICTGCRIPLSLTQARALRASTAPLICETCGRILVPR